MFFRVIALKHESMKAAYRPAAHFDTRLSRPSPPYYIKLISLYRVGGSLGADTVQCSVIRLGKIDYP